MGRWCDQAHLDILGDKAVVYNNANDLAENIKWFNWEKSRSINWDDYSHAYNPEAVMKQFQEVLLNERTVSNDQA